WVWDQPVGVEHVLDEALLAPRVLAETAGRPARRTEQRLTRALELAMALGVALAGPEHAQAKRDRDGAQHKQRPYVTPHSAQSRPVEDRGPDPMQCVGRRRDGGDCLHPLGHYADRVVDA